MMTATQRKSRLLENSATFQPSTARSTPSSAPVVNEDKLLERILRRMSQESYEYLRQRDNYKELSFTYPAGQQVHSEEDDNRKTASKLVNFLQGVWKFNYGRDIHFFIVPNRFFQRVTRLTIDQIITAPAPSKMPLDMTTQAWLLPETRDRIAFLYAREVQN